MVDFFFLIYLWLCWVLISVRGLSPAAASGGHSPSRCAGLPPPRPLLLQSTGSRRAGPAAVAHGPSCSVACGILPDQGWNLRPLNWQADSQPLRHQGSPYVVDFKESFLYMKWNKGNHIQMLCIYMLYIHFYNILHKTIYQKSILATQL